MTLNPKEQITKHFNLAPENIDKPLVDSIGPVLQKKKNFAKFSDEQIMFFLDPEVIQIYKIKGFSKIFELVKKIPLFQDYKGSLKSRPFHEMIKKIYAYYGVDL